jgi:VanZ family protein
MQRDKGKRPSAKRIVLLTITLLMLAFIFLQSVLPTAVSADESGWLTERVLNPLLKWVGLEPLSQHVVRKAAHILEFAVFSALLTLCFLGNPVKSFGAGFAAAFLDESIQLLSGRGASLTDVWIDLIGVTLGTLLGVLIRKAVITHRKRKQS